MTTKSMRVGVAILFGVLLTFVSTNVNAQLVVIPQEKVHEAASPTLADEAHMLIQEGVVLNFGTLSESDPAWQTTIHWRDAKGRKTTITRITTSCSCVEADWNKRAGATTEGAIEIKFHPQGRLGGIRQMLLIYTTLSDQKPTATITLVGKVVPSDDHSTTHPYAMGPLRLRQTSLSFSPKGGVEKIAVINSGSKVLTITHDQHFSSEGIKAYTIPRELAPGEEGDLVVEWQPNSTKPTLLLEGIDLPTRKRKIDIRIKE